MLSLDRQNEYRERYRQIRRGWRSSGETYESMVRQYIAPGKGQARVLDLGCGAGGVIELLSRQVPLAVGVDPDLDSLRGHRDQVTRLCAGRAECLPFDAEAFDLVTCSWVLEHLARPAEAFGEIARVLRVGGHLVFLTPNARNPIAAVNRLVPRLMQNRLVRRLYGREERDTFPTVYAANSVERIDVLARTAALRPVQIELVSDPTYLAFNDALFRLSVWLERRMPRERFVHIVGDYAKG
jgi:ubiquinone/menaquinone biosynthesis C-methylase UbiE